MCLFGLLNWTSELAYSCTFKRHLVLFSTVLQAASSVITVNGLQSRDRCSSLELESLKKLIRDKYRPAKLWPHKHSRVSYCHRVIKIYIRGKGGVAVITWGQRRGGSPVCVSLFQAHRWPTFPRTHSPSSHHRANVSHPPRYHLFYFQTQRPVELYLPLSASVHLAEHPIPPHRPPKTSPKHLAYLSRHHNTRVDSPLGRHDIVSPLSLLTFVLGLIAASTLGNTPSL